MKTRISSIPEYPIDKPIANWLTAFIESTRATKIWLRSDLFWTIADELCGPDAWLSSLNDVPVYFGKKHERLI